MSWLITGGAGYIGSHFISQFSSLGSLFSVVDKYKTKLQFRLAANIPKYFVDIRDFIHVIDIARGYLASAKYLSAGGASQTLNIGTGTSVLEIVTKIVCK